MTATYDLIASNVLTSPASSVTFSSIPATYRDLVVAIDCIGTGDFAYVGFRFNSDTSNNYLMVNMFGDGSSASSGPATTENVLFLDPWRQTIRSSDRTLWISNIMDYSVTDKQKSVLMRGNRSDGIVNATAGRWASTSAISSITALATSTSFGTGSSFHLYGIVS